MKELYYLIKINFLNTFKIHKFSSKSTVKKIIWILLFLYVLASLLFTAGFQIYNLLDILIGIKMEILFIPLMFVLNLLITILTSVYNTKGTLFECKDNDLLLSMPIKNSKIMVSRFLSLYLYNMFFSLLIFIASAFVYSNQVNVNLNFYLGITLIIIFGPLIPTIISTLIGYLLAFISSKTKYRSITEYIYYFVFIGLYFYVMTNFTTVLNLITDNPKTMLDIIKYLFLPVYLINEAMSGKAIYYLYFILINLGILTLFVLVLKNSYFNIISNLNSKNAKRNYKAKEVKVNSVFKALLKKDFKRFITSPIYAFNIGLGIFALPVMALASFKYTGSDILKAMEIGANIDLIKLVFIMITFVTLMTNSACVSISLEKNNLWILKSMPIKTKDILKSKLYFNYLLILPISILSLILFTMSGYINISSLILLLFYLISLTLLIPRFGLLINLIFPKLNANSDAEIVKRSASVLIGMLVPLFLGMFGIGFAITTKFFSETTLIISVICLILAIILEYILRTYGVKRFEEIS